MQEVLEIAPAMKCRRAVGPTRQSFTAGNIRMATVVVLWEGPNAVIANSQHLLLSRKRSPALGTALFPISAMGTAIGAINHLEQDITVDRLDMNALTVSKAIGPIITQLSME